MNDTYDTVKAMKQIKTQNYI